MDDKKYAAGGKLALGSKTYTLGDESDDGFELDGDGAFSAYTLDEDAITELIDELGATYEAPAAEAATE